MGFPLRTLSESNAPFLIRGTRRLNRSPDGGHSIFVKVSVSSPPLWLLWYLQVSADEIDRLRGHS